jgi:hypothetical protein
MTKEAREVPVPRRVAAVPARPLEPVRPVRELVLGLRPRVRAASAHRAIPARPRRKQGTNAAPFGTGSRQPIPAGSSPPSNTTITNPTGTYDSGGNPALTSPLDKGNTGTVPAYDATPNTNPAATAPANGTNGVRNGASTNNPANANHPATTNDTRGTGAAGSGTSKRDYR